jgi:hypothetical protein
MAEIPFEENRFFYCLPSHPRLHYFAGRCTLFVPGSTGDSARFCSAFFYGNGQFADLSSAGLSRFDRFGKRGYSSLLALHPSRKKQERG